MSDEVDRLKKGEIMDWTINIGNMPGPQFLLVYGIVIVVTLIGCRLVVRYVDSTSNLLVPPVPQKINPYYISYLRNGKGEVLRLILFNLMERGYLKIKKGSKWPYNKEKIARESNPPNLNDLSEMERYLFNYYIIPREPVDIFKSIPSSVEAICEQFQERLQEEDMLPSSKYSFHGILAGVVGSVIISGLGGYKLMVALERGKSNVGFLILFAVFSLIALVLLCRQPRITNLGRRYVEQLQHAFEGLKIGENKPDPDITNPDKTASHKSELLLMGIFGVSVLAGTQYSSIGNLFHQATTCSGNCSSGGGGFGGGGCGGGCGGGGCGGGCGGCGG